MPDIQCLQSSSHCQCHCLTEPQLPPHICYISDVSIVAHVMAPVVCIICYWQSMMFILPRSIIPAAIWCVWSAAFGFSCSNFFHKKLVHVDNMDHFVRSTALHVGLIKIMCMDGTQDYDSGLVVPVQWSDFETCWLVMCACVNVIAIWSVERCSRYFRWPAWRWERNSQQTAYSGSITSVLNLYLFACSYSSAHSKTLGDCWVVYFAHKFN